ncbi:MAG TPA: hypothetical protein VGL94_22550 [Ktedonobacteraceae bacterium]|jgi:hypothetical protein
MGLEQLSELYYTPEQARKKLGMTRDAFNHYVKTGIIKKTNIVGKHGHFMKRDIDMLATSIASAMLAAQSPDIRFKKATLQDQEKEFELAVLTLGENTTTFHAYRRQLLLANPDMSYYVYDREHLVASINIMPLEHEGIIKFREGVRGWLLGEYVERLTPGKQHEVIIIDMMTTPLVPVNRRTQYAMHLFFNLSNLLVEWAKQGIEITNVLANGGTLEGRRLLETAGFTKLGERENHRIIYELDVTESELQLIKPYKEALAEYKATKQQ